MKAWVKGAVAGFLLISLLWSARLTKKVPPEFVSTVILVIILGGLYFSLVREDKIKITYSKIIFYLTVIVIYFLFLEFFYDFGLDPLPEGRGTFGIGYYLFIYAAYFSWFLIASLAYFSRTRFDGMMIGLTIWTPWVIRVLVHPERHGEFAGVAFNFYLFLTILGALVGIIFGFVGSKRRKDTSGGNSEVLNEQRSNSKVEVRL